MKISRHARNSMRLYKIVDADIIEVIESPDKKELEGEKVSVIKGFDHKFGGLPLKVIYKETSEGPFVITAYPLKKKHWR